MACIQAKHPYTSIAPGVWRGVLHLSTEPLLTLKQEIERYEAEGSRPIHVIENELPFLFEVSYPIPDKPFIEIINAAEKISIDDIRLGRNKNTAEDTFWIDFPVFDSHLRGIIKEGIMQGDWIVRSKNNYTIPFTARFGKKDRFDILPVPPKQDFTGHWSCLFDLTGVAPYPAVGEFIQSGSSLTGTFRTPTGDYRYLDGVVSGDKFYMSCFDGAHAFLFTGKFLSDTIVGVFRSGKNYSEVWKGSKNAQAALPSSMTMNKSTGQKIEFAFLNPEAETKKISDYTKSGKLLQIMGTWCPNCYDETRFLTTYFNEHPDLDIDFIALAAERYKDTSKSLQALRTYREKMKLPYDILLASTSTNKMETTKQLPFLDSLIAYPTLIFVNKNRDIQFIHTGFDGPATSKHQAFKEEFDHLIKQLLITK